MTQADKPPVYRQEHDGRLRGFAERIHFPAPRRDGAAAVMDGSPLNDEAAVFQRETKRMVGRGLLGINPDDQHTGGTQELHQPVKRDFKAFERAPPPID
jgi:hypothetical protein